MYRINVSFSIIPILPRKEQLELFQPKSMIKNIAIVGDDSLAFTIKPMFKELQMVTYKNILRKQLVEDFDIGLATMLDDFEDKI